MRANPSDDRTSSALQSTGEEMNDFELTPGLLLAATMREHQRGGSIVFYYEGMAAPIGSHPSWYLSTLGFDDRVMESMLADLRRLKLVRLVRFTSSNDRQVIDVLPTKAGEELVVRLGLDVELALVMGEGDDGRYERSLPRDAGSEL